MKREVVTTLAALSLSASTVCWAADSGATLYKTKCAACHGAAGEGKKAIKAPPLKGTTLEASQLTQHITKGEATSKAPHNKGISGVTEEQATAIAEYIKALK